MGRAIAVRTDYRSGDVRRVAQRVRMLRRRVDCWQLQRRLTAPHGKRPPRSAAWIGDTAGLGDLVQRAGA